MSVNFRLKATKIIDQRKVFYRQRISESSCARKKVLMDFRSLQRRDKTHAPPTHIKKKKTNNNI